MANRNAFSNLSAARLEAALHASYEIESLAVKFPEHDDTDISSEYVRRLFIGRIKELACVVMSVLDEERSPTDELRQAVGLPIVEAAK